MWRTSYDFTGFPFLGLTFSLWVIIYRSLKSLLTNSPLIILLLPESKFTFSSPFYESHSLWVSGAAKGFTQKDWRPALVSVFLPHPPAPHPTWWVPLGKERKPAKAGSIPFFKHLPNSSGKYTLVTCDSITLTKNRIRSLLFMITKYYRIPFFFFFDLFGWKKDLDPSPPVKQPPQGPEWPSPHDCTSSVSDELVLIQLLNLVQLQRLSHTSFFACPLRVNFLFTHKPILLTQLPCSKQYSHLPCSSTHVKGFFPQNSLSFLFSLSVLLKIERTWP